MEGPAKWREIQGQKPCRVLSPFRTTGCNGRKDVGVRDCSSCAPTAFQVPVQTCTAVRGRGPAALLGASVLAQLLGSVWQPQTAEPRRDAVTGGRGEWER